MKRIGILMYGVVCYLIFFTTFMYLIGFTGNLFVPKGIDGPLMVSVTEAILTDLGLILLFAVQHSIMARSWFKKWLTQMIPESMERSTYVLFSSLALMAMFYFWQPLGGEFWKIESPFFNGVLMATFALGWVVLLTSSFLINHFDLFGLRQVWLNFQGKPYTYLTFRTPLFYKFVRHPLYLGFLIAVWSAGTMSYTRLFFAVIFTIYVLRAIRWEESDLVVGLGEQYEKYRERVPMILPSFKNKTKKKTYQTIAQQRKGEY